MEMIQIMMLIPRTQILKIINMHRMDHTLNQVLLKEVMVDLAHMVVVVVMAEIVDPVG